MKLAEPLGDHGELRSLLRICAPAEKIALVPCILMPSSIYIFPSPLVCCALAGCCPIHWASRVNGTSSSGGCVYTRVYRHTRSGTMLWALLATHLHSSTLAASVATGGRDVYYWKSLCWGRRGKGCKLLETILQRSTTDIHFNPGSFQKSTSIQFHIFRPPLNDSKTSIIGRRFYRRVCGVAQAQHTSATPPPPDLREGDSLKFKAYVL